ncbi:protein ALP1-like [Salvia hispanica]|uniref:protein ALP1-like n=1 Tax=Salvia hispanica TaxID=49212 RepID=UPI00200917F7|nr:protein ALP1-like [Salvia hispanica]
MGETTSLEVLRQFCKGMREVFGPEFLRKPTSDECQRLLDMHGAVHSFPGMMGSIDCMHWEWKNCPVAWKGQFTTGFKSKHPSMILEAVADYRLRIRHAYFGVAGSNNDINVLQSSPIFNDECRGEGPEISFVANGTQYRRGYYLADGIYPRWPVFVKTLRQPAGARRQYFARKQEAARKDVERAFGVLQARWAIIRCPARVWHEDDVANIMLACIILHNMIIEDEGFAAERWAPEDGASTSHGVASAPIQMGVPRSNEYLIQRFADIRRSTAHLQL